MRIHPLPTKLGGWPVRGGDVRMLCSTQCVRRGSSLSLDVGVVASMLVVGLAPRLLLNLVCLWIPLLSNIQNFPGSTFDKTDWWAWWAFLLGHFFPIFAYLDCFRNLNLFRC